MSRNLRARVERLERRIGATGTVNVPPLFCQAIDLTDYVEEYLSAVASGTVQEGDTFESFVGGRKQVGATLADDKPHRVASLCTADTSRLPPLFWQALCGAVPLDQLDPQTRRLVEPLFTDGRRSPDPIEKQIRQALLSGCIIDQQGVPHSNASGVGADANGVPHQAQAKI